MRPCILDVAGFGEKCTCYQVMLEFFLNWICFGNFTLYTHRLYLNVADKIWNFWIKKKVIKFEKQQWAYGKGWPWTFLSSTRARHALPFYALSLGPPLKHPYSRFRGGPLTGRAACCRLVPFWTPPAVRPWKQQIDCGSDGIQTGRHRPNNGIKRNNFTHKIVFLLMRENFEPFYPVFWKCWRRNMSWRPDPHGVGYLRTPLRIARAHHPLPLSALWSATLKQSYNIFRGGCPLNGQPTAVSLPPWIPHAMRA
jgi:hypothetical protein